MSRNLHTQLTSLLNSATLRTLTYQRGHASFFFARRVAEFWEFLLLAKQESTWSGPSYGLGVNGGCARLLQPYLPVPGTKIKTLKVTLRSTIALASPAPWGGPGRGFIAPAISLPHRGGLGRGFTALASPAPWGGPGRGFTALASPAPWGGSGRGLRGLREGFSHLFPQSPNLEGYSIGHNFTSLLRPLFIGSQLA